MKTFSKRPGAHEELEWVRCAVCGAESPTPHWECGSYRFVRCTECKHIYQSPRPTAASLAERYDDEYATYEVENSANFLDLMVRGLADVDVLRRVETEGLPKTILDIGCATGALLEHLSARGYQAHGVEPCEPAAAYGREVRGVTITTGVVEDLPVVRTFSVVHSSHVIEHVPDPASFLDRIRTHLTPGGYVVLVTPNTSGLQARLFGARWRSAIADHVNLFSLSNLTRLTQDRGFERVAWKTWGGVGIGVAPKWLKRPVDRLAKTFGFGDVMLLLLRRSGAV